jgi:polysaccharide export outer membrane protein
LLEFDLQVLERSGMKGRVRPVTCALALLGAALVQCLTVVPARTQGRSGADVATYRVGAGDVLRVDVAGRTDLTGTFTVTPEGNLVVPIVGTVQVLGRTPVEIQTDLTRRVSLFDRAGPQVTVTVAEFKSRKFYVLGAVLLPGNYAFTELPTVWDAISKAGGPLDDADLSKVEVVPGEVSSGRSSTVVDVAAAIRSGRLAGLQRLRPGDTVRVPRLLAGQGGGSSVLLFGAVARPGPLPYEQAPDLATALSRSGGPTVDAKLSRVSIIRRSGPRLIHMKVDLEAYFSQANSAGNPTLEPGDTVYLPGKPRRTSWLGLVSTLVSVAGSVVVLTR